MPGEHLDLASEPEPNQPRGRAGRRFVGIHFTCCDVYTRVYINREETAYVGHCPRCARRARLEIGPGGSDSRMFTAS